ncbi:ribosomal RNA small subunit methyltransferase A [Candidatus Saccharibacteria bacterium]|nr:ribosomal RNA small subunit methyltransferase A [Candidatus Saccharibacteria bacterium]
MKNKKSLGQNWLKDRTTLEEIADIAADFPETRLDNPPKICIEIGPGLGTLTSSLLKRFDQIIAIEFDPELAKNLPKSFPGKNLVVKNEDILNFDFGPIKEPFIVSGNIPYYITTPIIKKLLTLEKKPEKIVLLVQKEVAEKICEKTKHSSLSLFVDNLAKAELGPIVKKDLFTPPPKVDSQVIIFYPFKSPKYDNDPYLSEFIQKCFLNPRKKLSSNLSSSFSIKKEEAEKLLQSLSFSKNVRPSDLNPNDYTKLAKIIKKR